jgi:drug/metabolite transporter (DMT)-like permease
MSTLLVALACVVGISIGQILFKLCAESYRIAGPLNSRTLTIFVSAIVLYGITTLVWIWVLQRSELGKIYPLMALAFILVPLSSYFIFGERFSTQYLVGIGLIATGIFLTAKG